MEESFDLEERPWEPLQALIEEGDARALEHFLASLSPSETARVISRIPEMQRQRLLSLLEPAAAAELIEDVPDSQAVDLMEDLPADHAAAILEELDSDHVVDLLGEMEQDRAEELLSRMSPEDAEEARQFLTYPAESAGGLMISEFLSFEASQTVGEVLEDLRANREEYADYHVQYMYVLDDDERLVGVLRMHDLLFPRHSERLGQLMIRHPLHLPAEAGLMELYNFFEQHSLFGVPVVGSKGEMLGVVLPDAVEEARRKKSVRQYLGLSGIIGGDEFRSMPLVQRSGRRLSWLCLNIGLNILAASVIAMHQDTLAAAIALAVFLPMVSDMSGCSGNQAVAVSMRELSLGLVRPNELLRVLGKEASVGVVNGVVLGAILGLLAFFWKGNPWLGFVVGGALAANTLVAVCLGGLLPLLLKRLRMDPALVSSPLLTTVTDMCGFFLVLSLASSVLPRISG